MILLCNKLVLKDETKRDREESRARKNKKMPKTQRSEHILDIIKKHDRKWQQYRL